MPVLGLSRTSASWRWSKPGRARELGHQTARVGRVVGDDAAPFAAAVEDEPQPVVPRASGQGRRPHFEQLASSSPPRSGRRPASGARPSRRRRTTRSRPPPAARPAGGERRPRAPRTPRRAGTAPTSSISSALRATGSAPRVESSTSSALPASSASLASRSSSSAASMNRPSAASADASSRRSSSGTPGTSAAKSKHPREVAPVTPRQIDALQVGQQPGHDRPGADGRRGANRRTPASPCVCVEQRAAAVAVEHASARTDRHTARRDMASRTRKCPGMPMPTIGHTDAATGLDGDDPERDRDAEAAIDHLVRGTSCEGRSSRRGCPRSSRSQRDGGRRRRTSDRCNDRRFRPGGRSSGRCRAPGSACAATRSTS